MRIAIEFLYCSEDCINFVCPWSLDDEEQHLGHTASSVFEDKSVILCSHCIKRVVLPPNTTFAKAKKEGMENVTL